MLLFLLNLLNLKIMIEFAKKNNIIMIKNLNISIDQSQYDFILYLYLLSIILLSSYNL